MRDQWGKGWNQTPSSLVEGQLYSPLFQQTHYHDTNVNITKSGILPVLFPDSQEASGML